MATANEVQNFLLTLKAKMILFPEREILILNTRPENTQTLADLEITVAEQMLIIKNLTIKDFSVGPLDDDKPDRGLNWWVFGRKIKGKDVYIKLSLNKSNEIPICMSFHFANKKIEYPHKK